MAITAIPVIGSQLDRAIVAYLIANGVGLWRWTKQGDCVIWPADGLAVRTYPNVTVWSHRSTHTPVLTGIEEFETSITCKFSAAGAVQAANPYAIRVARDAILGLALACMLQSDDGSTLDATARAITAAGRALVTKGTAQEQANNADMAAFTCLHVYYLGTTARGLPEEEGCDWVEVRGFRISACPSAIDMDNLGPAPVISYDAGTDTLSWTYGGAQPPDQWQRYFSVDNIAWAPYSPVLDGSLNAVSAASQVKWWTIQGVDFDGNPVTAMSNSVYS
jgi:hypothetical protein